MKLALLVVATLALECSSWTINAENIQKDAKLPGKIQIEKRCCPLSHGQFGLLVDYYTSNPISFPSRSVWSVHIFYLSYGDILIPT